MIHYARIHGMIHLMKSLRGWPEREKRAACVQLISMIVTDGKTAVTTAPEQLKHVVECKMWYAKTSLPNPLANFGRVCACLESCTHEARGSLSHCWRNKRKHCMSSLYPVGSIYLRRSKLHHPTCPTLLRLQRLPPGFPSNTNARMSWTRKTI